MKTFQRAEESLVDEIVGPQMWDHLFNGEEVPTSAIHDELLANRGLAPTGSFETGAPIPDGFAGLSSDFDGQEVGFASSAVERRSGIASAVAQTDG